MRDLPINKKLSQSYKYLTYLVTVYSFFFLLPSLLLRKMVDLPFFGIVPISILFTGIYFMLLDVVTEVYGYHEGKRTLYAGLVTYSLFVLIMETATRIPSPANYHVSWSTIQDPNAYNYIFSNIHLVWFSVVFCALFANTVNIMVLSRWKILTRGKYFWMRSVTTSFFAALLYSVISNLFAFGIFLNESQIFYFLKLVFVSMTAKLITLLLFAYPCTLLCNFLKKKEGIDVYDYGMDFKSLRELSYD